MKFKKFLEEFNQKVNTCFSTTKQTVIEFIQKKSQTTKIVFLLGAALLFFILLLVSFKISSKKKKSNSSTLLELHNDQPILFPRISGLDEHYKITRKEKPVWDTKEADKWFKVPDEKDIKKLEKTNDKIISSIIEGAQ